MIRLFRRLRSDERGAAVIELALTAPILATLVIGIVDISNAYSRQLSLEQAAPRGHPPPGAAPARGMRRAQR